jgi:uncharacterized protein (TIGR03435 family)
MKPIQGVLLLAILTAGAHVCLSAQTTETPAFEVVSVKPNDSGSDRSSSMVMPGGRYNATNATLRMMIRTAYQVHDDQIVGGPDWISTERFDLMGKAAGNPPVQGFIAPARLMLRAALAERFKLTLRNEQREIPVYALVSARADGRTGPQLMQTDMRSCEGPPRAVPVVAGAAETSELLPCDSSFARPLHLSGRGRDFSTLVNQVYMAAADRVVVDRTGLTGRFDWDLQWTLEPLTAAGAPAAGISLFTALQEQLGLRLESARGPVDVLVIVRAERPGPD